jgi:hypothetical protein
MAQSKPITLREAPHKKSIMEKEMRYEVLLNGNVVSDLFFNMRGYLGGIPTPEGGMLEIGERPITTYRREIAMMNKEFAAKSAANTLEGK